MFEYYLKYKKGTENKNWKDKSEKKKKKMVDQCYHQNVLYVAVNNLDL